MYEFLRYKAQFFKINLSPQERMLEKVFKERWDLVEEKEVEKNNTGDRSCLHDESEAGEDVACQKDEGAVPQSSLRVLPPLML